MATLVHLCGFEEGGYSDGPFGAGVHGYVDSGSADGLTWDTGTVRNGRFSLRTGAGSRIRRDVSSTAHIIGSIWFRWTGLANATQMVSGTMGGFRVDDAGVVEASAGGSYTAGPTVAVDTWHLLEWYWNASANPRIMKWRVNGSAQSDVSYAAAATTSTAVDVGFLSTVGKTGSIYFDDWALSATGGDYPLGPIAVEPLYPTGDGTHVEQAKFKDETGTVSTGSSTYAKVVPKNAADYWYQSTISATAYLEWTLSDTTRTNPILGVVASTARRKRDAIGSNYTSIILHANGNDGTIYAGSFGYGGGGWLNDSTTFATAPGGAAWTPSILNGATIRFGYSTDVGPPPQLEMVVVEVAWDDDPNESPGGGDPDPVVGVPGIWIDWVGDGTWVDETTRTISVNWSRGASSDHVSAAGPGNATVILQNSDDRFNPDNGGSALTGLLTPNRPIWCGADRTTGSLTSATEVRGFFAGYVTELAPLPVPGGNPTAELLCEDALGTYRRATATVSPVLDISRGDFRQAVLTSLGESVDRRLLENEYETMPFASSDARDALGVLEDLNRADSARHFIAPADSYTDWYDYTLVNRLHKLANAEDEAWNADDVTALDGYRVTTDNINNLQRATVSPISFGSVNEIVWTATPLPMVVTVGDPITLWPEFADYVFDAAAQINSTGGTLTTTLTNFGTSAKLELTASGSVVNITALDVTGSSLRRGDLQTVRSEDLTSQATYGIRAGGDVSTDYIGQPGAAKAVTDYLIWKFADPLKRPSVTIAGKGTATVTTLLDRDLFDVITLTVDRLQVVARRFEIIGIKGTVVPGGANPFFEISYELQETPNQAPIDYFMIDEDAINGAALIAPF